MNTGGGTYDFPEQAIAAARRVLGENAVLDEDFHVYLARTNPRKWVWEAGRPPEAQLQ